MAQGQILSRRRVLHQARKLLKVRLGERARDERLRIMLDLPEVFLAAETLGVNLVDGLRALRPGG